MLEFLKGFFSIFLKKESAEQETPVKQLTKSPEDINISILNIDDIRKVKLLYPGIQKDAYKFLIATKEAGISGGLFCSLRTFEEQDKLYAQGRTKPGSIVTNAKGGQSYHNYGIAFDFVFKDKKGNWTWNGDYNKIGKIGESLGFEWGGSWSKFPDKPHFQKIYNQSVENLLKVYNKNKKVEDVWTYLNSLKK